MFTVEMEEDGESPSHRLPPDTLPSKTLLVAPLCSDGLKYVLATNQSCLESDKLPLSGLLMRGKERASGEGETEINERDGGD